MIKESELTLEQNIQPARQACSAGYMKAATTTQHTYDDDDGDVDDRRYYAAVSRPMFRRRTDVE